MFYSILFCNKEQHDQPRQSKEPAYFKDLNLGQIVLPILEAKKEFHLDAFFYTTLRDQDTILYRQNVMRELKDQKLRSLLTAFSKTLYGISRDMDTARRALLSHNSLDNNYLARGQLLDCAEQYCGAVSDLEQELSDSDVLALGGHMMDAILSLGAPAVIVTFLDELALYGKETVSMMSTVKKENPSEKTFKIIRKPPDGLAYAMYIAGKHGLTYEQLSRRIQNESTSHV